MSELIQAWLYNYFTEPFMTVSLIIAFIISIQKRKDFGQYKIFPVYFLSFLILQFVYIIYFLLATDNPNRKVLSDLGEYIDGFVTLFELIAFVYFFYSILKNKKKKNFLKWVSFLVILLSFSLFVKDISIVNELSYSTMTSIYILESFVLLISATFYYLELFSFPTKLNLLHEPNFWTTTGITFYSICTLPISFVLNYFYENDYILYLHLFSIINLFYTFLFALIIRSYLCKAPSLR